MTSRSLKSRALQLLAQREQSRVELRRKLMVHANAEETARRDAEVGGAEAEAGGAEAEADTAVNAGAPAEAGSPMANSTMAGSTIANSTIANSTLDRETASEGAAARVDAVLAWLETNSFLSDQRFAESRVHARAARYGNLRIRQELKQHGVALPDGAAQALQDTEWSRALGVWQRRFSQAPETAAESAKQARFLTARGFSPDVVRRVLRARRVGASARETTPFDD